MDVLSLYRFLLFLNNINILLRRDYSQPAQSVHFFYPERSTALNGTLVWVIPDPTCSKPSFMSQPFKIVFLSIFIHIASPLVFKQELRY